jgi:succinate-acetate transporter protein
VGWGGASGFAAGTVPCSIFFGGILLTVAGLLEWILGNNFPFLVFFGYGAHILTFATTFMPSFDAIGWYSEGNPYKITPGFAFQFSKIHCTKRSRF